MYNVYSFKICNICECHNTNVDCSDRYIGNYLFNKSNETILDELKNISSIDLSYNVYNYHTQNFVKYLKHVKFLNISHNYIHTRYLDTLYMNRHLNQVDLSYNLIKYVFVYETWIWLSVAYNKNVSFNAGYSYLEYLDASHCSLKSFNYITLFPHLKYLNLSYNLLTHIDIKFYNGYKLLLNNNKINYIIFIGNVKHVDLYNNYISVIDSNNIYNISYINVLKNNITCNRTNMYTYLKYKYINNIYIKIQCKINDIYINMEDIICRQYKNQYLSKYNNSIYYIEITVYILITTVVLSIVLIYVIYIIINSKYFNNNENENENENLENSNNIIINDLAL